MKYRVTSQAGDTIVEVIIAVAVISSILAGAFIVTNRSTRAVRDSEEHAQALQLLQGQVELLRHAAAQSGALTSPKLVNLTTPFCIDSSGVARQPASTQAACTLNSIYNVSISSQTATPNTGSTTTFNLKATWPALGGGTSTVYLSYNVEVTP